MHDRNVPRFPEQSSIVLFNGTFRCSIACGRPLASNEGRVLGQTEILQIDSGHFLFEAKLQLYTAVTAVL